MLDSGNDSQSTLTMAKNSLWTLTGNSQLNSLQNEQSVIDMTGDNKAFSTLSVETLTGNGGTIIMDIDGSQVDASDKIYVTGDFSGSQTLSLKEINGLDSDPGIGQAAENTVLASVNGSGTLRLMIRKALCTGSVMSWDKKTVLLPVIRRTGI